MRLHYITKWKNQLMQETQGQRKEQEAFSSLFLQQVDAFKEPCIQH
jgi:hypothetical protein